MAITVCLGAILVIVIPAIAVLLYMNYNSPGLIRMQYQRGNKNADKSIKTIRDAKARGISGVALFILRLRCYFSEIVSAFTFRDN